MVGDSWEAIEAQLVDWRRDPSQLEDDGLPGPTVENIDIAIGLIPILRERKAECSRVVQDAQRGVVFEFYSGKQLEESVHICNNGTTERFVYENCNVIERTTLREASERPEMPSMEEISELATEHCEEWLNDKGWNDYPRPGGVSGGGTVKPPTPEETERLAEIAAQEAREGAELTPEEIARLDELATDSRPPTTEELSTEDLEEERRLYGLGR